MKTVLSISLYIALFSYLNFSSLNLNAQAYCFMNDSATWKIDHFDAYFCCDNYKYYLEGDTIINSTAYKKLRTTTFDQQYFSYDYYEGAIRSDSILRKVYLIYAGQATELLLYDFALNTGDTIDTPLGSGYIVLRLDSILIGNQFHKKLLFNIGLDYDTSYLIEGVGSNLGLLQHLYDNSFEVYSHLTCFKVGNQLLYSAYSDTSMIECDLPYPLAVSENLLKNLTISPNPVQNLLTVVLASGETIAVYDVQGRKIVLPTIYSNNKAELTTTTLPNGIYLLQIINTKTGMSEVGKFVKEE